jgi:SHS2 domain-containing protein
MAEHKYEISKDGGQIAIKAFGKTRAGLFTCATHALFEAMGPVRHPEHIDRNERGFSVTAESPEILLAKLLNEVLKVSAEHQETCEELRLNLITDKKVEGAFVGCAVTHFDQPVIKAPHEAVVVSKNEQTGEWEAEIRISG